jgi:hypothetical protein
MPTSASALQVVPPVPTSTSAQNRATAKQERAGPLATHDKNARLEPGQTDADVHVGVPGRPARADVDVGAKPRHS